MTRHRLFAFLPLVGLGLAACGGSKGDHPRVAVVEVTSSPSGLPVQIDLNSDTSGGTTYQATTPDTRNAQYDPICSEPPLVASPHCSLVGLASVKLENPNGKRVSLCLTDAGKRRCASSDTGFVVVSLDFENF